MKQNSHYSRIVLVALIIFSAVIGLFRFDSFQVGAYYDDAYYIVLAESFASGQGYRLVNYPNAPIESGFPPGWPILLSPLAALFPGNYEILKLLSFVLWLVSIPLLYKFFAKRIETPYREILIALIALNPLMLAISGMVMAEAAYLFFSVLTLYLFEEWDSHQDEPKGWLFLVAIVTIAVYTQLIRTVGLSILIALIAYSLVSRRFRQAGIVAVIVFLEMLPQFWLYSQAGGSVVPSGYESQVFGDSISTKLGQVWANAQFYFNDAIANSIIPIFGLNIASALDRFGIGIASSLANIIILLLIGCGFVLSLQRIRVSELYVFLYCSGMLAHWFQDKAGSASERFLIPIIPFLYFYFLKTLIWSVQTVTKSDKRSVLVVAGSTCLIMFILLARNVQDWLDPARNQITDISIGTVWVSENTPPESIIMARNPVPDYLYALRKTVEYPTDGQDIEEYIRVNNVDYIIVSPKLQVPRSNELGSYVESHLLPVLVLNPDNFVPVYTNAAHNVTVYEYRGNP